MSYLPPNIGKSSPKLCKGVGTSGKHSQLQSAQLNPNGLKAQIAYN